MRVNAVNRVVILGNDGEYFLHHRRHLADRLAALGCRLTVITGGRAARGDDATGWDSIQMPIDRLSLNPVTNLGIVWGSFRHFLRLKPQAVHLLALKPGVFGGMGAVFARLIAGEPQRILITITGLGRLMSPDGGDAGLVRRIARFSVGRAARFLSRRPGVHFTFENEHDRQLWVDAGYVQQESSTIIRGAGCDPSIFYPAAQSDATSKMRILFASRLLRSKGLVAFMSAAKALSSRPDVEFIVAGMNDPADTDDYPIRELEREPAIRFLGYVQDMPALLRQVDLVVLPTRYGEGIPRILIEAAATGLASVATDMAGCREIVINGKTGTLLKVSDDAGIAASLVVALERYLHEPSLARTQGAAALEHFRSGGFSADDITRRFVNLILGSEPLQR